MPPGIQAFQQRRGLVAPGADDPIDAAFGLCFNPLDDLLGRQGAGLVKDGGQQILIFVDLPLLHGQPVQTRAGINAHTAKKEENALVKPLDAIERLGQGRLILTEPPEQEIMGDKRFGDAGSRILVEDKLSGEEVSVLALVSGRQYSILVPSQDHKRAYDGDEGPNTGGMGAYAPASIVDSAMMDKIEDTVIRPAVEGLSDEGVNYFGVLYAGLMIREEIPYVLEFNVRFGDPETEAVLPLMKSDLSRVIMDLKEGISAPVEWKAGACLDVVVASGGYPGEYRKGVPIRIDTGKIPEGVELFHAGTVMKDGSLCTSGGRVLNIAAVGEDIEDAREKAYKATAAVVFEDSFFRKDIGSREMERQKRMKDA